MDQLNKVIAVGVLVVSVSVGYYFAIALPSIEREKLAFDKLKYENKIAEDAINETLKAETETKRVSQLIDCQNEVIDRSNRFLHMNGEPVKGEKDVFNMSKIEHDERAEIEKDGNDNCIKLYGK